VPPSDFDLDEMTGDPGYHNDTQAPLEFQPGTLLPASTQPVQQVQARQMQRVQRQSSPLDDIDARLKLAQYYRTILEQPLFDSPGDPYAHTVENEVRSFIMERMGVLVGATTPPPPAQFTAEEVASLKAIAKRLMSTEEEPEQAPPRPVVPAPPPPPKPQGPQVMRRSAPAMTAPPPQPPVAVARPEPIVRQPATATRRPAAKPQKRGGRKTAPVPAPGGRVVDPNLPKPIPMPTGSAMTAAMQMKAHEALCEPSMVSSETIVKLS
jgi:hypothetical protein